VPNLSCQFIQSDKPSGECLQMFRVGKIYPLRVPETLARWQIDHENRSTLLHRVCLRFMADIIVDSQQNQWNVKFACLFSRLTFTRITSINKSKFKSRKLLLTVWHGRNETIQSHYSGRLWRVDHHSQLRRGSDTHLRKRTWKLN
jgi:hypothetical protein